MSKINIKLMSEATYATLRKNIESYSQEFKNNPSDPSWINNITTEGAFETKKYQVEDFELFVNKGRFFPFPNKQTDLRPFQDRRSCYKLV